MVPVIKLHGVKESLNSFREMPRRLRIKHLRIALNAGGGVLKRATEGYVPNRTGMLKKSLGVKVTIPFASHNVRHHTRPAYVVVGPRRKFMGMAKREGGVVSVLTKRKAAKHVSAGGKLETIKPSRYAHLVEQGTASHIVAAKNARVLSGGTKTGRGRDAQGRFTSSVRRVYGAQVRVSAKPNPFTRKAVASAGANAQQAVTNKLRTAIAMEAYALARR